MLLLKRFKLLFFILIMFLTNILLVFMNLLMLLIFLTILKDVPLMILIGIMIKI